MENFNMNDLFSAFTSDASLAILLIMIGAFLLGWLAGWLSRSGKIKSLQKQLKAKDITLQEEQAKMETLHQELNKKETDYKILLLELDEAKTKQQLLETDRQQLQMDLNQMIDQHRKLKTSNQAYADTIDDLNKQLKEVNTQAIVLGSSAQKSEDMLELQQLYNSTRNKIASLELKLDRLELDNQRLQNTLGTLSASTKNNDLASPSLDAQNVLMQPSTKNVLSGRLEVAASTVNSKDDLTLINGIGPFIEKKLNDIGFYTYNDVARWTTEDIERITAQIQFFPGRIQQDNWVGQAAALLQRKNEGELTKQNIPTNSPNDPRDLKIIEGIGPKTEELLKENAITNWIELSKTDVEHLRAILRSKGAPFSILDPTTWPEQARLAANAEWERLKQYQDYLIGGRG
jgi:predicted flap endonuclease-1-like 5' DNA nuclease